MKREKVEQSMKRRMGRTAWNIFTSHPNRPCELFWPDFRLQSHLDSYFICTGLYSAKKLFWSQRYLIHIHTHYIYSDLRWFICHGFFFFFLSFIFSHKNKKTTIVIFFNIILYYFFFNKNFKLSYLKLRSFYFWLKKLFIDVLACIVVIKTFEQDKKKA